MIKVKICGIKTREAAVEADQNGADFIGFIFYRKSHRYINPFKAAEIARSVKCKKVGVFVDENVGVINGMKTLNMPRRFTVHRLLKRGVIMMSLICVK